MAFVAGGGNYSAPAQRVGDFLAGRPSTALGAVEPSYTARVHWTDLSLCLPPFVIAALREAIPAFDKQIHGFAMADAVLTGVETRTSSPIRIKRGATSRASTRAAYTPPAKAPVTPAASCRPASTASRWRKRWPSTW
jgi:uncharacterized FAD-dependent dehydrogenase